LDFYSASSLKQQSADRNVAPLGHIIMIPSHPVFALTCLLRLNLSIFQHNLHFITLANSPTFMLSMSEIMDVFVT
jgi:ankyrin repeat protein